jgi:4-amino-4-deoxy-L-arabinose transferase-like glycosyltransferase
VVLASWRAALIGALVAALTTLPGLGVGTLWDNSETAYGEVAREILLAHDWIVLHLNGAPWFVQPPLYFWIAASFAKAFGVSELTLRLPSALATIVMSAGVGYVVARVASERAAIVSATVLSTALMQAIVGRLAIMDALLDLAVTFAIFSWFGALRTGSRRWWYLGWLALGLGVLAKGPVALAMALIVVGPWALWTRAQGGRVVWPSVVRWLLGVGILAAVVAPWAFALLHAAGPGAIGELVGHYTVGRYLGTIENQSGPIWYYVPVVILGVFPWFAFLVPSGRDAWHAARERTGGDLARLALVWAVVPFVFFSLAKTKLPNYIALEIPACAILVGLWFDRVAQEDNRRVALAWTAVVPVTIAGVAFALWAFSHDNRLTSDLQQLRSGFLALGCVIFIGSAACFALLLVRRLAWLAPFALAAASVFALLIIAHGEPIVERYKPIPPLAAAIERERRPGDVVAIDDVPGPNALVFYTQPVVATDVRQAVCSAPRAFVISARRRPAADPTYGRMRRVVATSNNDVLFIYDGADCK